MGKIKEIATKSVSTLGLFSLMLATSVQTAFAANYSITEKFVKIFDNIRSDLVIFSSSAAGVCVVVCLLTLLFTKNEKATQVAWDWLKRIVICYVCIISIVSLISFAKGFKF
jgi:hypothetical protein